MKNRGRSIKKQLQKKAEKKEIKEMKFVVLEIKKMDGKKNDVCDLLEKIFFN